MNNTRIDKLNNNGIQKRDNQPRNTHANDAKKTAESPKKRPNNTMADDGSIVDGCGESMAGMERRFHSRLDEIANMLRRHVIIDRTHMVQLDKTVTNTKKTAEIT